MSSVLFLDPVAPNAYGGAASSGKPLGGTESTVLRIAASLVRNGFSVTVAQSRRSERETDQHGVLFLPYDPKRKVAQDESFQNVVLLRADKLMKRLASQYPRASRWLWMHCFPGRHRRGLLSRAKEHGFTALTVSHALRDAVLEGEPDIRPAMNSAVEVVYNPVSVADAVPGGPRDRDKLVFFSSPHKGLEQVLERFQELRARWPDLTLYLANPGYIPASPSAAEGVVQLGPLPHGEVLRHVGEAFCVLYPQTGFAETFGLVFAEANAMGTPVIAHPLGSAEEVLGSSQVVDCRESQAVLDLFQRWREEGPPSVAPDGRFSLESVTRRWMELLNR